MALIKCPECRQKVSDKCGNCPNCGYPIEVKEEIAENNNVTVEKKQLAKK